MARGRVKNFDPAKGWGFIREDGGLDIFVHVSALHPGLDELRKGDLVEFEIEEDHRQAGRFRAASVRMIQERTERAGGAETPEN